MALTQSQLYAVVGVLAILFVVIVVNNVLAARARHGPARPKPASSDDGPAVHPMVAKFARHEGSVVGEGVAVADEHLILKQAGVFKAVPLEQAKVVGEEIVLSGSIDWTAAQGAGAAWHASHRAAAIPEVSGQLTRSEDVKAPALESTKDR